MLNLDYDPEDVTNLAQLLENQKEKVERLRERVRRLEFVPVEPTGAYMPITFKSLDGGIFNLHFDPFEFDIVEVADSNGNVKLKFAAPAGNFDSREELEPVLQDLNDNHIIKNFLGIMNRKSLQDVSEILTNRRVLMEISELACIFDMVTSAPEDHGTIILKDGLLRTKTIKAELILALKERLAEKRNRVKVVGVAKTSRLVFLLQAAILCEKIFPEGQIGYVKIPLDLENMAYRWSSRGRLRPGKPERLEYAFGSLYIAKLSKARNMFVTVEIPERFDGGGQIYSDMDTAEIMGYLAKDAMYSYPVMGYPQTIMKAHEFAARLGLPSSILRDRIMSDLIENTDPALAEYIRGAIMLSETMDRSSLGGRA